MRYFVVMANKTMGDEDKWLDPELFSDKLISEMKTDYEEDWEYEITTEEFLDYYISVKDGGYPGRWFEIECMDGIIREKE